MTEFDAVYYDGRTSARTPVRARRTAGGLHIAGAGVDLEVALADIAADAPLAGAPRSLHLPGGAQLKTEDQAAVEALFPLSHGVESAVHLLEGRWRYALGGLAVAAAFGWWSVVYGLPLAASLASSFVSTEIEARMGDDALATIDQTLCGPSRLDDKRRKNLQAEFAVLTAGLDDGYRYRLEFRACPRIGANAFALPGGAIVLTDGLAALAQNDQQVAAVLAHEIGHVRHRHGLRKTLQAAGVAALVAALAGDAVSITGLAAALPAALLDNGYSRAFEEEADDYAFQRMKEAGIPSRHFADVMALLEKKESGGGKLMDYLSTHPATAQRIERARSSIR